MSIFKSITGFFKPAKPDLSVPQEDPKPQADFYFENGKIKVKSFNKAFIADLKTKIGDIGDGKSDEQLVQLYLDRENVEREEPRLDVVHMGIAQDGSIKMQLDWNRSFINHLRENNIEGATEEQAVQKYLAMLTHDVANHAEPLEENAFAEIDAQLGSEFEAAKKQSKSLRKPKRSQNNDPDMSVSF